jgi:uncharacterized phage protein (predicted DNA packaging)
MLLDEVKLALRVSTADFDGELEGIIDAAKADLVQSGVSRDAVDDAERPLDPFVRLAIIVYAKATWGLDNPDSEKFWRSFYQIEKDLTMSSSYNGGGEDAL